MNVTEHFPENTLYREATLGYGGVDQAVFKVEDCPTCSDGFYMELRGFQPNIPLMRACINLQTGWVVGIPDGWVVQIPTSAELRINKVEMKQE